MSVVFIEGWDYYSAFGVGSTLTVDSRWMLQSDSVSSIIDVSTNGRYEGSQSLYMNRTNATGASRALVNLDLSTLTQYVIGFGIEQVNFPVSSKLFLSLVNSATGSSVLDFYTDSTGTITVKYDNIILGTSNVALVNSWSFIEIEVIIDSSAGALNIYSNGNSVLSLTNINTQNISNGNFDYLQFSCASDNTYYLDDLYITDSLPRLGDARVLVTNPSADTEQLTMNVFPSSNPDHFSVLDGTIVDYDDGYIYGDADGQKDVYELRTITIETPTIYGIQPIAVARKDESGSSAIQLSLITDSNTVTSLIDQIDHSSSTFYRYEGKISTTNPDTSAAWTSEDIESLKLGIEIKDN